MIRNDFDFISDEELDQLVEQFNNTFIKYFKDNNILEEYVSYYIAERINCNFLFREKMDDIIFSALNDLSQFCVIDCDYNKIKQILHEKYKLEITNDNPLNVLWYRPFIK